MSVAWPARWCFAPMMPFPHFTSIVFMSAECRAVDPHSFFTDPDPAVILDADPDPAAFYNAVPDPAKQKFVKITTL